LATERQRNGKGKAMEQEPSTPHQLKTPEQLAALWNLKPHYARWLFSERVPKHKCPKMLDRRDVVMISKRKPRAVYTPPNVTGFGRPRLVDRP